MESVKRCGKCGRTKPLTSFHKAVKHKYGRHVYCKSCAHKRYLQFALQHKDSYLKRRYGISLDQVNTHLKEQDFRCRICGDIAPLEVDHSHATGKFRGMICAHCNRGLGHFRDDAEVLRKAIFYLEGNVAY